MRLSLWNHPGDGIYGMFARCRTVVETCELLLEDEVYHYHSKMIMKEARVGGAWAWHQDYGYWYQNGVLFPDLVSVFIAVDPATRENGCLQVLRGSQPVRLTVDITNTGSSAVDLTVAAAPRSPAARGLSLNRSRFSVTKPGGTRTRANSVRP